MPLAQNPNYIDKEKGPGQLLPWYCYYWDLLKTLAVFF